ncbi:MAG TPA: 2-phosphosulfolactate phosphatase [Kribbella sp.]|uniref:2-phosphosulfolactate phosphatase n=1 Tax=Kribbella sp. TaxID=1871183 RepID=UPI002D77313F|nr:2-phosphosulfolactate phosphatase [Kribbella sp.]HET6296627.1 2-phosphosulfolactate phosphatase [Kribbella sp.]
MTSPYAQSGFRLRFDWGPAGAAEVGAGLVAVVDVLSFTTAVTVAVDQGIDVLPYRWRDESAAAYAEQHDAVLAVGRSQAGETGISLSPASIRRGHSLQGPRTVQRLVLPSPNGSTISQQLAASGSIVLAVSLRNISAAAAWTAARMKDDPSLTVAAIAAGERWSDGSLRPAVEDLWGAGGFLTALVAQGVGQLSPEARAAAAAYRDVADDLPELLYECAGGRELTAYGFPEDVAIAAELDSSKSVPTLEDVAFRQAETVWSPARHTALRGREDLGHGLAFHQGPVSGPGSGAQAAEDQAEDAFHRDVTDLT